VHTTGADLRDAMGNENNTAAQATALHYEPRLTSRPFSHKRAPLMNAGCPAT
jgi:hypothetical protein